MELEKTVIMFHYLSSDKVYGSATVHGLGKGVRDG